MDAVPCLAQVDLSLGSVLALQGRADEANGHFEQAIERQEALEALPDLCESYLTRAQFLVGEGRLVEAEFYLGRGEGLISRADCQPLNALLFLVQGEVHLRSGRAKEARICFENALSQARRMENPYQEAKALAGLGRAAMERKEHDLAEAQLFGALAICRTLGARVDALELYRSLEQLFLSRRIVRLLKVGPDHGGQKAELQVNLRQGMPDLGLFEQQVQLGESPHDLAQAYGFVLTSR
ncbi:MAG: hypothetical protein LUQ15_03005 [Methanothrix sp.]|nr:hypothetical protein [Methanothrix sp.]